MGQAFRRATGRIRPSGGLDSSPSLQPKNGVNRRPPVVPVDAPKISKSVEQGTVDSENSSRIKAENVLETRDPKFDAMLSHMVGRISTKPGGKLEMGEAFVVERYKRPMPKLRNTTANSGRYEERDAPPGTLNVAQVRRIFLLHQGKADDHNGPMDIQKIAEMFRVDVGHVQRMLQFLSLPPEDNSKQETNQ